MVNLPNISLDGARDRTYHMCFGCGKDNPIGLKLKFKWDGKEARAEFISDNNHQGWPGYVHGGILMCLLDEAFGYTSMYSGFNNVTARVQVRLKRMALVGEPLVITCRIASRNKRLIETEATVSSKDGTVIAEGSSTQFIVSPAEKIITDDK